MATNVETKLRGLYQTGNEVNAPEGSFSQATDVWHPEPNVIQPRPTTTPAQLLVYDEPNTLPEELENTRALLTYGSRTILHAGDTETLGYQDGISGPVNLYSTPVAPADEKARTRGTEAGKNLYITSAEGIYRLSGTNEPDLAGAPVATGFVSATTTGTAGWLNKDMAVAYRCLFTTQDAFERLYVGSPSGRIIATNTSAGTRNILVSVLIPPGVTTDDYLRVYRTAEIESDIDPGDEMGLIHEIRVTAQMLSDGFYEFEDSTPSEVRGLNLYTNPNSGQGILQANDIPPAALDVATWGNRLWAANTKRAHSLNLELLGVGPGAEGSEETGIRPGDVISIVLSGGQSHALVAKPSGMPTTNTPSTTYFPIETLPSPSASVRETTKNLVKAINESALGDRIRAIHTSGPEDPQGRILIENIRVDDGSFTVTAFNNETDTDTFLDVLVMNYDSVNQLLTIGWDHYPSDYLQVGDELFVDAYGWGTYPPSGTPTSSVSGRGVVTGNFSAIAMDPISYTGDGNMDFDPYLSLVRVRPTAGTAWSPNLDVPVESKNDTFPHRLCYSKLDEFEAFPKLNYLDVGDDTKAIRRIVPMRDRLYVFKEDGIFLVTGEFPFRVDVFDPTVRCFQPDSVAVANNVIFGVFDNAIYAITEGGAKRIDGNINPSEFWHTLSDLLAVGDSKDGRYILWDASGLSYATWVYNIKTGDWVTWNLPTKAAVTTYGENAFSGSVSLIRFGQLSRLARAYEDRGGDLVSIYSLEEPVEANTLTIPTSKLNPHRPIYPGDYLSINDLLVQVYNVAEAGGITTVIFESPSEGTVVGEVWVTHYAPFSSTLTWCSFHGGDISGRKVFREGSYIFSKAPTSGISATLDSDNTLWDQWGRTNVWLDTGVPGNTSTFYNRGPTPQVVRFGINQEQADCVFLKTGLIIPSRAAWELIGRSLTYEKSANYTGAI